MRSFILTILTAICIIAALADAESLLLLAATKVVAVVAGAAAYLLYEWWVYTGKMNPIKED